MKRYRSNEPVSSTDRGSALPSTSIAKITPPKVPGIVRRKRLFDILSGLCMKPIIWIASPAGSGKTTLVSSWLEETRRQILWYQLDNGDSHSADFFYYMGLAGKKASPRRKDSLPLLTPEYLQKPMVFAKRYFDMLFDRLRRPSVIVFDNYQDVPERSGFHAMLAHGLAVIPEGIKVIVLSRREPPKEYACLDDRIHHLRWDDLRFSLDEFREFVILKGADITINEDQVRFFYQRSDGWAAGITLYLESLTREGVKHHTLEEAGRIEIFNYFAGEILEKTEKHIEDFLLRTSFLPALSAHSARKLTGLRSAGTILSTLSSQSLFTKKHSFRDSEYQYHPLFRDYLQARARESFTSAELVDIQERAALILEEAGRSEEGAALLIEAGKWGALVALILRNVQNYIAQGRGSTVEEWIERIPRLYYPEKPWFLYWHAMCCNDPDAGCTIFERAFTLFEEKDDWEGMYSSWSRIVESVVHAWKDFTLLDRCIAWMDSRKIECYRFPSKDIEADVAVSMVYGLTHRQFGHPDLAMWVEKALSLTADGRNPGLRIKALLYVSQYYTFMGDGTHALIVFEELKRISAMSPVPVLAVQCAFMDAAVHEWADFNIDRALASISEGLACAEKFGIGMFNHLFYLLGASGAMGKGCLETAGDYLDRLALSLRENTMDACHYDYCASWYHVLRGDIHRASVHAVRALECSKAHGVYFAEMAAHHAMAQIMHRMGKASEARFHLDRLAEMVGYTKSAVFAVTWLIAEAQCAMDHGECCTEFLERAFSSARAHGIYSLYYWWDPALMSRLCSMALDEGIEVEYVRRLIGVRKMKLNPPCVP